MMKTQRGFTLLMAVLISSVLLALGYQIYNLAVKEVTLSSAGRESQFAFFAADSGIECALFADSKQDAFATTSVLTEVNCGIATSSLARVTTGTDYITTFAFTLGGGSNKQCVNIKVTRKDPKRTIIESYGHNTCDLTSSVRLERAIRVTY
jgi:Tfp pilus assembly protein PilE